MDVRDLEVYQQAMALGERVWTQVVEWRYLERSTIGKQLIRSADSIAANVSEGHGRYHYAEKRRFCQFARGSLYETRTWIQKAYNRDLLDDATFSQLDQDITRLAKMLNGYIRFLQRAREQAT